MDTEQIFLEPSATAGLVGPLRITGTEYLAQNRINAQNITHIAWATGGDLVPQSERAIFLEQSKMV
ncbi:MAG TPA: hypothetical protein VFL76_06775 [Edaphocola sp.]|nr:hypothetical protein [Edaphocola sp.]